MGWKLLSAAVYLIICLGVAAGLAGWMIAIGDYLLGF